MRRAIAVGFIQGDKKSVVPRGKRLLSGKQKQYRADDMTVSKGLARAAATTGRARHQWIPSWPESPPAKTPGEMIRPLRNHPHERVSINPEKQRAILIRAKPDSMGAQRNRQPLGRQDAWGGAAEKRCWPCAFEGLVSRFLGNETFLQWCDTPEPRQSNDLPLLVRMPK